MGTITLTGTTLDGLALTRSTLGGTTRAGAVLTGNTLAGIMHAGIPLTDSARQRCPRGTAALGSCSVLAARPMHAIGRRAGRT